MCLFVYLNNHKTIHKMKNLFLLCIAALMIGCNQAADLSVYKANQSLAEKFLNTYVSPTDYDTFVSMIADDIQHQSPMYGQGIVGKDAVYEQAKFYMNNFSDVSFNNAVWLPGVDNETLIPDGSVRVYGTWKGISNASGKSFSVDSYHYFLFNEEGKVVQSGDFFDATGMVMAVAPDQEESSEEE